MVGRWLAAGAFLAVVALVAGAGAAAQESVADIPRLDGIVVDGDAADWGERGFRVEVMTGDEGRVRPPADFDPRLRLGWSEEGLLVLATVRDNVPVESDSDRDLWAADSVELFLARAPVAANDYWQLVVSPGRDPRHPQLRTSHWDYRARKEGELTARAARSVTADGYTIEVLMPWGPLQSEARVGAQVAFQVLVNDADAPGAAFQVLWHPRAHPAVDTRATHLLRLVDQPSPPVAVAASGAYERMRRARVDVLAVPELVGKTAELRGPDGVMASAVLAEKEQRAAAALRLPAPPPGQSLPALTVAVDGQVVGPVGLPDLDDARARAALELPFSFRGYVFDSPTLPAGDFEDPGYAEDVLGPYQLRITYYDRSYQPVTIAAEPGRYGAVVEVIPERGRPLTLYRTLFRVPPGWERPYYPGRRYQPSVTLGPSPGIDPRVAREHAAAIAEVFDREFSMGTQRDQLPAALLAGLYEGKVTGAPATVQDDALAQDRQWWVGLKRKLYSMESAYPQPFVCPRPKEGAPAPVLRPGSAAEAGMNPDAAGKIDAVLQRWAADSDQGFAVCVARHGVIVLQKAYGERDGRPVSLTDNSWMASITKLLSGTLMMMLVDQGRVGLDDPVAKLLPPFRVSSVPTPLTIRHLYTHTNGLWGHWGDEMHDFDQVIGWYYPRLQVGKQHSYNGAGYAIGGKVIEIASGEALPLFYKHHLLDPLGCEHTEVFGTSWDARSTALDIARIAQMLLNKGAYGDMRFFGEETWQQMLPVKLDRLLGPETTLEWGIGVTWFGGDGLSPKTFGHGAASSATLRIDPVNDLVVVMTRETAGRNFDTYHKQFLAAVVEGLAE